jgi:uncharacterized protein YndB with AHSA1/START domain
MSDMPVEVSMDIDAPPEVLYQLVSDLPRMGEWSPECTGVRWKRGSSGPVVGAKFKGHNRRGIRRWSADGLVVAADPNREVAWDMSVLGLKGSHWSYLIEPRAQGGCRVTESYSWRGTKFLMTVGGLVTGVKERRSHNESGMRATLEKLKAAAEAAS